MTHTACIAFAPVFTVKRFEDPAWKPERILYESGALRFLPSRESVPLVVDHDDSQEIGVVHALYTLDFYDEPWICAKATIRDKPSWLKRDTPASFGFKPLYTRDVNIRGLRADVVGGAIVEEVSVLSPTAKPAEPLARVVYCHEEEPASSPEVIWGDGRPARRYFETPITVRGAHLHSSWPVGEVVEHLSGGLVRTASGQVLGVR